MSSKKRPRPSVLTAKCPILLFATAFRLRFTAANSIAKSIASTIAVNADASAFGDAHELEHASEGRSEPGGVWVCVLARFRAEHLESMQYYKWMSAKLGLGGGRKGREGSVQTGGGGEGGEKDVGDRPSRVYEGIEEFERRELMRCVTRWRGADASGQIYVLVHLLSATCFPLSSTLINRNKYSK